MQKYKVHSRKILVKEAEITAIYFKEGSFEDNSDKSVIQFLLIENPFRNK